MAKSRRGRGQPLWFSKDLCRPEINEWLNKNGSLKGKASSMPAIAAAGLKIARLRAIQKLAKSRKISPAEAKEFEVLFQELHRLETSGKLGNKVGWENASDRIIELTHTLLLRNHLAHIIPEEEKKSLRAIDCRRIAETACSMKQSPKTAIFPRTTAVLKEWVQEQSERFARSKLKLKNKAEFSAMLRTVIEEALLRINNAPA
ncbi:MAG TPA: hypothetical protein VI977_02025 [archaeon]|nr:hypothetical protein [archaeon]